jgi:hypothetical protein
MRAVLEELARNAGHELLEMVTQEWGQRYGLEGVRDRSRLPCPDSAGGFEAADERYG